MTFRIVGIAFYKRVFLTKNAEFFEGRSLQRILKMV